MAGEDVIELLVHDHREVQEMFDRYRGAATPEARREVVEQAVIELVRHSVVEEQYLYPAARKAIAGGESIVEHELAEHAEAERVMKRLEGMAPTDPGYEEAVTQLMRDIAEHIADEEGELFPRLREAMSRDELVALGDKVQTGKKLAPTRPHPAAPDRPPLNKLLAPGAGLVDRVRDWASGRGE
jgi:hemerythrin superfamily protein